MTDLTGFSALLSRLKGVLDFKKAKKEEIPFSPEDLEAMVGQEFYLAVWSVDKKIELTESLKGRVHPGALEKLSADGHLLKIISREPYGMKCYVVGDVAEVLNQDGRRIGFDIPEKETYKDYIFHLQFADLTKRNNPILRGYITDYNMATGKEGGSGQRVILIMQSIVDKKQEGLLGCLGGKP